MHINSPAEIFGVDGIIVLIVVVLVVFGSAQIPKLARSLGSAQKEFKKGINDGASDEVTGTQPELNPARHVVVKSPGHAEMVDDNTAPSSRSTSA